MARYIDKIKELTDSIIADTNEIRTIKAIKESMPDGIEEGKKEEYEKFFKDTLKKYDANSPADLSDEKKKEFFNEIEKGWNKEDVSDDDKSDDTKED